MRAGRQRIDPRIFMLFCPGLLWSPTSLLLNGHRPLVPGGKATGVILIPHLRLVPMLRIRAVIPLHRKSEWEDIIKIDIR